MASVSSPPSVDECTPPLESGEANSTSLGELLRHARENRGLTLEKIANETKIPRRYLEALEHDDLAATPGAFYRRAEIRAYARAVGLDQNRALARLEFELKADEPCEAPRELPGHEESTSVRAYVPIVLGIAIVAAAGFGYTISERSAVLQDSAAARSAADSQSNAVLPVRGTSAAVELSQRKPSDRVAQLSAPPESIAVSRKLTDAGMVSGGPVMTDTGAAGTSAASFTELVVTTQPAGARVTVNGIGWGISPVTIRHLTPGDKRIRVTKDGYVAEERVLRVPEGRSQSLDIPLDSAP